MFGPYPFTELGGVVPAHRLWFGGLETQTRPVYEARSISNRNSRARDCSTTELAHMWFGRQRDRASNGTTSLSTEGLHPLGPSGSTPN